MLWGLIDIIKISYMYAVMFDVCFCWILQMHFILMAYILLNNWFIYR